MPLILTLLLMATVPAFATEPASPAPPPGTQRKLIGFRLSMVEKNSIYERVGLRVGDIVKSLDGQPVTTPQDIKQIPNLLENHKRVEIKVQRGEKRVTLRYRLEMRPIQTAHSATAHRSHRPSPTGRPTRRLPASSQGDGRKTSPPQSPR